MTKNTHLVCAYLAMGGIFWVQGIPMVKESLLYVPLCLATTGFGALFPDIDTPHSTSGRKVKFLSKKLNHRGITHTLLFPSLFAALFFLLPNWQLRMPLEQVFKSLLVGLIVGWSSHIFIDLFNKKGCPILWPLVKKRINFAEIKTRSKQESIFLILYFIASFIVLFFFKRQYNS